MQNWYALCYPIKWLHTSFLSCDVDIHYFKLLNSVAADFICGLFFFSSPSISIFSKFPQHDMKVLNVTFSDIFCPLKKAAVLYILPLFCSYVFKTKFVHHQYSHVCFNLYKMSSLCILILFRCFTKAFEECLIYF